MARPYVLLVGVLSFGCGARTGLEVIRPDASPGDSEVDVATDAPVDVEPDSPKDAGPRLCPLTPPKMGSSCPLMSTPVDCLYEPAATGTITAWCCFEGGWVNCTTVSMGMEACSDVMCPVGLPNQPILECIIGGGTQCCTCGSSGMALDNCGPC